MTSASGPEEVQASNRPDNRIPEVRMTEQGLIKHVFDATEIRPCRKKDDDQAIVSTIRNCALPDIIFA